ncbi:MAG: hypothetical protein KF716_07825 [Anaerolineae bacterium]|nr:hypothetical protein [Anaerolineae bacterium]
MATPQDVQARLNKSLNLIKAGRTQDAKRLLYRLLKDEPNNAQAWYLTSYVASTFDKQMKSVKKALLIDPAFVEAAERRAELLRQGDVDVDATPSQPMLFHDDLAAGLDLDFPQGADDSMVSALPFPTVKYIVGMVVGTTLMILLVLLMARIIPVSSMIEPAAPTAQVTAVPQ